MHSSSQKGTAVQPRCRVLLGEMRRNASSEHLVQLAKRNALQLFQQRPAAVPQRPATPRSRIAAPSFGARAM
eukprot:COSAG01_NODE_2432_length_7707_cov_17.497240_9_plen_72_part_00